MNLSDWRKEYDKYKLSENAVDSCPFVQFKKWFDEAHREGVEEPNAMSIATCGKDMMPETRMVLLKEIDEQAFLFYTNYTSAKGTDLAENPNASLLFYWEKCQRQVRIKGTVTKGSREKAVAYFSSRPENSQFSAIASPQSQEIELDQLVKNLEQIINNPTQAKCPENWGGYYVHPLEIEFWQGQPGRLHDRIVYKKQGNNWIIKRLAP